MVPMAAVKHPRRPTRPKWIAAGILLGMALLALGLANVSRPGRQIEGCLSGCATETSRPGRQLRILSLNMLHGFPDFDNLAGRLDLIAGAINQHAADIALLQEVPWNRELGSAATYLARETGMNYASLRANGNRRLIGFEEGELILSRFPLAMADFAVLSPKAGFFENRVVMWATAQTPAGRLALFVTHLTNGEPEDNAGQAATLAEVVAEQGEGPAVIAGDFNATESSPQIQALSQMWLDSFRLLHPERPGYTCCVDDLSAGPGEALEERIDYVFVRPAGALQAVSAKTVLDRPYGAAGKWQWASDHIGLLVTIRFSN